VRKIEIFKLWGSIDLKGSDKAKKEIDVIDSKAEKTGGALERFGETGAKFGGFIAKGAAVAGSALTILGGVVSKVGVDYNAMMEQSEIAWTTLLGSADKAAERIKLLQQLGAKTPFEFEGLDQSAKMLEMANLGGENLEKTLTSVGDAVSAVGGGQAELQGVATALFQMSAKGKVSAEEMSQMAERGIPVWQILSEKMGLTVQETMKMSESGKLLADEVIPLLVEGMGEKFGGAMDKQSKTFNGLKSTLIDGLKILAAEFSKPLFDKMKSGLENLIPIVDGVMELLKGNFAGFSEIITKAFGQETGLKIMQFVLAVQEGFAKVKGFIDTLKTNIMTFIAWITPFVVPILETLSSFIQSIVAKITSFWQENGAQITQAVQNAFNMIKSIIDFVMPAILFIIKMVWENIKGVINGALNIIMGLIKVFAGIFTGDFSKMWEGVKQLFSGALEFLWNLINLMLIGKLIGGIKAFVTGGIKQFTTFWNKAVEIFKNLDDHVFKIIGNLVSKVVAKFKSLYDEGARIFDTLRTFGANAFNAMWQAIKTVVGNIFNGVTTQISSMVTKVKFYFDDVVSGAKSRFNKVRDAIISPIQTAKDTVIGFIDKIKSAFSNMGVKIALPHFNVSNFSLNPKDWITNGLPKLSVDWYAQGTNFAPGGLAVVGERGPELVQLPRGSKVHTNEDMRNMAGQQSQQPIINQIILNGKVIEEQIYPGINRKLYADQQQANRTGGTWRK
jgi:tape measure domain-containing protein